MQLLQLRLRIEVPLWRDLTTARHPTADLPAEEDSASDATGSAERSPRLALPVPVGLAEPPLNPGGPHTVLHSRSCGNSGLEACGFPNRCLPGSAFIAASRRASYLT